MGGRFRRITEKLGALEKVPTSALVLSTCLSALACSGDRTEVGSRPSTHVLPHVDAPPCRIVFSERDASIGTGLEPDFVPDPTSIALGPDGRFYTGSRTGGIGVWSPAGTPLFTIGGRGEGPGEMRVDAGIEITPEVGPDGVLNVLTYGGRWYRFRRSGEFIDATHSAALQTALLSALAITEQGNVLSGQPASLSSSQFHVIAPDGVTVSEFGELPVAEPGETIPYMSKQRSVAPTLDGTFWTAPHVGSPDGYRVEEWTLDGSFRRAIVRTPEWFPEPWPFEPPGPLPPIVRVYVDGSGRLVSVVELTVTSSNQPEGEAWLEVIDPEGPTVLASRRLQYQRGSGPFGLAFFQNTDVSWTTTRDSLGLQTFRVADYRLVSVEDARERDASVASRCTGG